MLDEKILKEIKNICIKHQKFQSLILFMVFYSLLNFVLV